MDNADEKLNAIVEKIKAIREQANQQPAKKSCHYLMEEICDGKKKAEHVKCCNCNQLKLKKVTRGTPANPYVSIECYYVDEDGVQCGFIHTCGQAELSPPEVNKPDLKIF
jgi:hypothetical protein